MTSRDVYTEGMLQYHVAYHLPSTGSAMVVAEVLDFPGVLSQGFDLQDARSMIASALTEMAQLYLEQGRALPMPMEASTLTGADLVERMPLSLEVPASRR